MGPESLRWLNRAESGGLWLEAQPSAVDECAALWDCGPGDLPYE
ncbi:MAG: hypothetical protein ACE5MI_13295 [Acidimicrobiia bacterium]